MEFKTTSKHKTGENGKEEKKQKPVGMEREYSSASFHTDYQFNPVQKCYTYTDPATFKQTRLRGIVKLLEALFYKSYDFQTCIAADKYNKFKREMLGMDQVKSDTAKIDTFRFEAAAKFGASKTHVKGLEEGKMIDEHVTCLIQNKPIMNEYEFPVDEVAYQLMKTKAGLKVTRKTMKHTHPLAQKFMRCMLEWGYTPECAQPSVGDVELGIATAPDNFWRNQETKGLAMVELKKYNRSYYDLSNDVMKAPYQYYIDPKTKKKIDIRNSLHNQHQLQLGWTFRLCQGSISKATMDQVDEIFIIQLDAGMPLRHDLEPWVLGDERFEKSIPRLEKLMNKLNKQRTIKLKRAMLKKQIQQWKKAAEEAEQQEAKDEKKREKEEKKQQLLLQRQEKKELKERERQVKKREKEMERAAKKAEKERVMKERKEAKAREVEFRKQERLSQKRKASSNKSSSSSKKSQVKKRRKEPSSSDSDNADKNDMIVSVE